MLDTITFDVWNTLLVHEYYDDRVKFARLGRMGRALEQAGFRITEKDLAEAYEYSESCLSQLWKEEKDLGLEGHLTLFIDGLGLEPDEHSKAIIREPYAQALLDFKPSLIDGAPELLAGLKAKGYKLGIISNTGRTPGSTIRIVLGEYKILKYFDSMVFSNEVGYIKPNRRIFERALNGLGSGADRSVHIGDSMLLDIYGARAAGMKAILFNKYSERFEQYATKYYSANGRYGAPDVTVTSLNDVEAAVETLCGSEKVNI
jgi:putative hydrolase of the HAD superfamily